MLSAKKKKKRFLFDFCLQVLFCACFFISCPACFDKLRALIISAVLVNGTRIFHLHKHTYIYKYIYIVFFFSVFTQRCKTD